MLWGLFGSSGGAFWSALHTDKGCETTGCGEGSCGGWGPALLGGLSFCGELWLRRREGLGKQGAVGVRLALLGGWPFVEKEAVGAVGFVWLRELW